MPSSCDSGKRCNTRGSSQMVVSLTPRLMMLPSRSANEHCLFPDTSNLIQIRKMKRKLPVFSIRLLRKCCVWCGKALHEVQRLVRGRRTVYPGFLSCHDQRLTFSAQCCFGVSVVGSLPNKGRFILSSTGFLPFT